jgi:excisionase family DNA binding protein
MALTTFASNRAGKAGRMTERSVVDIVRELAPLSSDQAITAILNRLGYKTGAGNSWTEARVKALRGSHNIPPMPVQSERVWMTLAESADELKVSAGTIRKLVEKKILPAKQVVRGAPWVISRADLKLLEVQSYISAVHQGKRSPRHDLNQTKMALL